MKTSLALSITAAALLIGPVMALAADDTDADRSHPVTFVKDSDITVKIKAQLAAKHFDSLGNIHVDTDNAGVVYLSGSAHTQGAIDQAVAIAKGTERVKSVHNDLIVKKDD
jgi:hyperosmotically inducible periplasmic protein